MSDNGNYYAQMHHAAVEAAEPYDIEEEAKRDPFVAAHIARCDAERERIKHMNEMEVEDGE